MKPGLKSGQMGELVGIVDPTMTINLGERGEAAVFSTPAMIMLMELAAREALRPFLEEGEESVGVDVQVEHLAAAHLGATVRGVARVTAIDGRRIEFGLTAYDGEREIGRGTHRRAVVALSRLLENAAKARGDSGQAMMLTPNGGKLPPLETLLVSVANRVASVTLNRPRALNAVNQRMTAELESVVAWLAGHADEARVVILSGAGQAFCAGDDVKELPSLTLDQARDLSLRQANLYLAFERLPQPIIAAVNGVAFGAGCVAAISCDLRLAAHAARFAMPEITLGWPPGYGVAQLTALVGKGRALELCLWGQAVSAAQAHDWGLVNEVVPAARLLQRASALAAGLIELPAQAVRETKRLVHADEGQLPKLTHRADTEAYLRCLALPDAQERHGRLRGETAATVFGQVRGKVWNGPPDRSTIGRTSNLPDSIAAARGRMAANRTFFARKENAAMLRRCVGMPFWILTLFVVFAPWNDAQGGNGRPWTPTDAPNTPIGVARGIFPGRVVWISDPAAALWDGHHGHWWDAAATDQARVDAMLSRALRSLTGAQGDAAAWKALFTSYNKSHGKGDGGYVPGQTIVMKINQNTARDGHEQNGNVRDQNSINGNPHVIMAMLRQLVHSADVAQSDIYIYDISRYMTDSIFVPCHAEFPEVHFIELDTGGGEGREAAPPERDWKKNVIGYSDPSRGLGRDLPQFIIGASYMINMAIMKNHGDAGPTLLAKNHFGTVHGLNHGAISPRRMGESNPMVDLLAHKDIGEKTVLFMIDAIYGADGPDAIPRKWRLAPFGTATAPGWPASLYLSQDGVAIESVGFDFVNAEWGVDPFTDNFLHEAALANDPPSGKKYGPVSLGVHEHWNNSTDKQYSRNLGKAAGIELVPILVPAAGGAAGAVAAGNSAWRGEVPAARPKVAGPTTKIASRTAPKTMPRATPAAPAVAIFHDGMINVGFGNKELARRGKAVVGAEGDAWNSLEGDRGEKLPLSDVKGAATSVSITFDADRIYDAQHDSPFLNGPWEALLRSYLVATQDRKVTLEGLKPGGEYSLYLYSASNPGGDGRATKFSVGKQSKTTMFAADQKELVEGVNYTRLTVTADSSGRLEIGYAGDNGGRPEGNLNGLQLAPVKKGSEGDKRPAAEKN